MRKLEWYAALGVPEYWIADAEARTLEQLTLREGRYLIARTAAGDAVFAPPEHVPFELPPSTLWQAMDTDA